MLNHLYTLYFRRMESLELNIEATENHADPDGLADRILSLMQEIYGKGWYPEVTIYRPWSEHNPEVSSQFARPADMYWYFFREFRRLLGNGAGFRIVAAKKLRELNDIGLLETVDEAAMDFTRKKLFLFSPERIELSMNRLEHYTGTSACFFQRYILFTNYEMHVDVFREIYPNCICPDRSVQMPAYHHTKENNTGITLINIGVGPSNAKTITDHVAVLRPDVMIMVGHCGGLRNHQEIGDFVLASGYMRADHVLDSYLPLSVPVIPAYAINHALEQELEKQKLNYRTGIIYTTDNRNWEFDRQRTLAEMSISRSLAVDMESATVAANGFRYRIPTATLLCVSDRPLHGKPKLSNEAAQFYQNSKEKHLKVVISTLEELYRRYPEGLPNSGIRAVNEPLLGS